MKKMMILLGAMFEFFPLLYQLTGDCYPRAIFDGDGYGEGEEKLTFEG